jgi:small-conductance mechanosensitive channel/CRP-like cAMP-binding protein
MLQGLFDSLRLDPVSLESFGLALAALLVLVLRLLLPEGERKLVRQPFVFLLLHLASFGFSRSLAEGAPTRHAASLAALVLLLASIGRSGVLLVLDVVLGRRTHRPLPRIVRDITQGLVWIAILLAALRTAGVEPGSILTTSALLTAAIALSLQETLGNMVAGLAIQVQHPFDVGDWIQFDTDAKHIGQVLEINWRATKVRTLDEVEVIVPNATLAKAPITNFTKPTPVSRRSIYAYAPSDAPPHVVQKAILDAIAGSFGVLDDPPPSVVTNAFADGNVEYWVRFFTDQFHKRDGVDGAARDRIWYALRRIGVTPAASPNRAVHMQEVSAAARERDERALFDREKALRNVDFLGVLSEEQLRRLASKSTLRMYVQGEAIVKRGDQSAEMFVVESGEVVVLLERPHPQEDVVVARLSAGQFFGEMALTTGEPRNATVRAAGPCTLLVIDDRALRAVLETAPGLAEHISRVIAERQAALTDQEAAASLRGERQSVEERSSLLLGKIRRFFSL